MSTHIALGLQWTLFHIMAFVCHDLRSISVDVDILWCNSSPPSAAYMHQCIWSALVQIMACRLLAPTHYLNQWWFIVNLPLGTNFSEILIKMQIFSFTKMHLKTSSAKRWPFCPGRNKSTSGKVILLVSQINIQVFWMMEWWLTRFSLCDATRFQRLLKHCHLYARCFSSQYTCNFLSCTITAYCY